MNSPRNTASVFQPAPSSLLQAAILFSISALLPAAENTGPGKPPVAKKIPEKTTLHNDSRIDEYSWLRDIEDPATRKYLQEENQYAESALQPLQPLAEALQQEIQGRIVQPTTIPSWQEGRYTYYTRSKPNSPYPVYCRKKGRLFAREEVLLDAGSLAREGKSHRVASFLVSPDHTRAAFTIDEEGQGEFSIRIIDLETGQPAGGPVAGTVDNFAWSAGGDFLFYARRAGTGGPRTIWLHRLGEKQENDTLLYHERDRDFTVRINKTLDGQFIWLDISNKNSSEVRYLRAADPRGRFQLLAARRTGVKYDLLHQGRSFYIRTNDGSPNSRLMLVPESDTARKNWREKIPAREGIVLENVQLFRHHLALFERHDGRRKVRIQNLDGAGSHYIDFPDHLYSVESWQNREFITNRLRMAYSSMLVPLSFFEYNMDARRWESIHEVRFKGYRREDYSSERIEAKSADGVTVPISLVYRKREKRTPGGASCAGIA